VDASLYDSRRVVVTGMGAVTPLGNDVETTWQNLLAGCSGAGPITHFDPTGYPVHFACEVKDFDPSAWIDRKALRRMDRFTHLVLAAARQAEADSGLDIGAEAERIGAAVATGIGGLQSFQDCYDELLRRGPDRVNPFAIPSIIPNLGAGWVSIELGTRGPLSAISTACAASNMAIGDSLDAIRLGRADAMIVLEELEPARARGASIYAEVIGYGVSSDAKHITEPDTEGPGRALRMAFADAGIDPAEIDYVNAHATATPLGDASETEMLKRALGEEEAYATPVSSTKGATGHCLGAAGAVESIFTILAIRDGKLPPTINLETPDPECDLDYVPNEARDQEVRIAVNNSFGFGGHNACVVFRRYEG
jgi:3-oxoacyl-[acyl-carrier-protein] synthase II